MIRSGAAALHCFIRSGSPLIIPMMFRFFITPIVSLITWASVVAAKTGFAQGGILLNVSAESSGSDASHLGIMGKGVHIGGGLGPV
jgi:hypothetical protein